MQTTAGHWDSEEEESEAQGRKSQDDPLVSLVQGLVTPSKTTVNASGREKEELLMTIEECSLRRLLKEQSLHEEDSLVKAIRLDTLEKEKRLNTQHYTDEDWDLIRAKIESNAELSKSVLGSGLQGEDFAKKMVELIRGNRAVSAEELTTKDSLKIFGKELQTKTSKRLKSDEAKDDESTKKTGKKRKQIARKGLHSEKTDEDESKASKDVDPISGINIPVTPVPVAMKPPSIATYKIIKQGKESVYQIVREDGTDIVYINFGAMLKDITRDDLTKLYRIVMNRYDKKLPGGKPNEDCYKLLKWMEKQAGIRKYINSTKFHVQRVDMVIYPPWNYLFGCQRLIALSKTAQLKWFSVRPHGHCTFSGGSRRVNTPGSDENSLKLYDLIADMKGC
ncbi:hypothetical protein Tco_0401830 [Tanacetum coccineum]